LNISIAPVLGKAIDYSASPTLSLAIGQMSDANFWKSPSTQGFILFQLPEYRLSKFQQVLANIYSIKMISNYLLDLGGVLHFLQ
jgi:ATP-dependent Lhr-like helicase